MVKISIMHIENFSEFLFKFFMLPQISLYMKTDRNMSQEDIENITDKNEGNQRKVVDTYSHP